MRSEREAKPLWGLENRHHGQTEETVSRRMGQATVIKAACGLGFLVARKEPRKPRVQETAVATRHDFLEARGSEKAEVQGSAKEGHSGR